MARSGFGAGHEIVDLLSDSEDDTFTREELEFFDAQSAQESAEDFPNLQEALDNVNAHFGISDRETIDLTGIPDIDVPPSDFILVDDESAEPSAQSSRWLGKGQLLTEAACVEMVLTVLPDISIDHVLKTIREKTTDATRTPTRCEEILTELLDGETYPKEADEAKNKKRKRGEDADLSDYERAERDPEVVGYERDASDLLKDEFLDVPYRHILNVLQEHKTFYKAYGVLVEQVRNYNRIASPFSKIIKSRTKRGAELILIEKGSGIPKELHAAKKKVEQESAKRRKAEEEEQAEEANLQQAQMDNAMGECACCYNDVPLNRMISCNGNTVHFFCLECPRKQIETQMGQSRCRPKCFGVDDCNGTFARRHLQRVLSERTFERLEHMQQQEDLKAAGLDFLSECPFCDFKMECPPVEVDKEFRCQNKKCAKTSCRLCEKESHIPLTCEEAKKDGQLTLRHIIEEAMSKALIRHCNNCKHAFIKEYGCNKMTCSHCRNVQCYVCSKNVTDYQHFGEVQRNKCPLHENVEDRHEQEVKRAADEAMAKVRADNPGLSDADLMIKVSDRVKQAEDARRGRAAADANAFPYHMVGDALRNRPVPLPGQGAGPGAGAGPGLVGAQPAVPPPNAPRPNPFPAAQYVQPMPLPQAAFPVPAQVYFPQVPPVQPVNYAVPPFPAQHYPVRPAAEDLVRDWFAGLRDPGAPGQLDGPANAIPPPLGPNPGLEANARRNEVANRIQDRAQHIREAHERINQLRDRLANIEARHERPIHFDVEAHRQRMERIRQEVEDARVNALQNDLRALDVLNARNQHARHMPAARRDNPANCR